MPSFLICLPVLLPIIAGVLMLTFPIKEDKPRYIVNFCVVIINSILAMIIMSSLEGESVKLFSFYKEYGLVLKLDRGGRIFGSIVALLWPVASLYAYEYMKEEKRHNSFFAFYTMTYGVVLGIAFAADLLSMYVFYEMLTLVTFPLVMHTKTREALKAGVTYLAYSMGGAAFGLIGIIFTIKYGSSLTFSYGGVMGTMAAENRTVLLIAFFMAFCGFSVKAAMMPFSRWLIKAAVAPTPVTALLHAVAVVNSGAFACIRLIYFVYGKDFLYGSWAQYAVMVLTIVTILYGSCFAVKEPHFKRRLAYSTISNLSYILFAATLMTDLGIIAAFTHMLMHSVTKICSFYCAGIVMEKAKKNYVYELDGIGKRMKITFTCFTISSLSLIGIPLFACFHGKWKIGLAVVGDGSPMAYAGLIALLLSALLTAIYMLSIVIRVFFPAVLPHVFKTREGKPVKEVAEELEREQNSSLEKCPLMLATIIIAAIAVVVLGIYWTPLFSFIEEVITL